MHRSSSVIRVSSASPGVEGEDRGDVGGVPGSAPALLAHGYRGTGCIAAVMAIRVGQQTKDSSSSFLVTWAR